MAGGKETPRQKMIGLMYLVLTAFLAISVDNAVLDKFKFLDDVLTNQKAKTIQKNQDVIQGIKQQVEKEGNRPNDIQVLEKAKKVRETTQKLIEYTEKLRKEIVDLSGGKDENGVLVGAKNTDEIADLMIRQKKGDEWKKAINEYCSYLSKETGFEFHPLALDGKEDPYFKKDPKQKHKDFSQILFESTPTIAGMASISQLENQILNYESQALEQLANKVGAGTVRFDKIVPMVLPESKVVAAGATYKAKMFISASASGVKPTMKFDGKPINVDSQGFGEFSFTATGGSYDKDGQVEKTFLAEISIGDTTFREKIPYIVAKPVVQIQSAAVQALYRNCGNELVVNVPALGQNYDPSFKVKGGSSYSGSKKGVVTIIPTSPKVTLSVYSSNNFIDNVDFNVRQIPKPDIVLKSGGKEVDEKKGFEAEKMPRDLVLDAEPDNDFASMLPKDARYRVTEWEITLARGPRGVKSMKSSNPKVDMSSFRTVARPGDRVVIEVKEVQRMNFKDQTETVSIPIAAKIKQIPVN